MGWRCGASSDPSLIAYDRNFSAAEKKTSGIATSRLRLLLCGQSEDLGVEIVEGFLKAIGMGSLGFRQGFEPIGNFIEAFIAC